jgi:4-amino-4-deoxy-L-arabinose transferase-like glycosyltransferase
LSEQPSPGSSGAALVALVAVVAVATGAGWALRAHQGLGLHYDEAQYYAWSLHPAWGYFSKPPLIAWAIALTRATCGDSEFCIRLPAAVALVGATLLVFATALRIAAPRTALVAALLFALAPLVSFLSLFMTTDSLLLLAWAAALYGFVRAVEDGRRLRWWAAAGAAAGVGLLAKYTMGIFALSALGFLLSGRERPLLRSAGPWLGVAIAALLFAPNLAWNEAHRFATFTHTATISELDRAGLDVGSLAAFLGAQVGVFGPLAWVGLALAARPGGAAWTCGRWSPEAARRLLLWFALPFLAVIAAQALAARANANWAAPTYVAASMLAAAWLAARPRWLAAALALNVALAAIGLQYREVANALGIGLRWRDAAAELVGWEPVGAQVAQLLRAAAGEGAPERLLTDDRSLLSWLAYYARPLPSDPLIYNPLRHVENHFDLLYDVATAPAGPFLFVSARDRGPELAARFDGATALGRIEGGGERGPASRHVLYAYRLGRFEGYAAAR